MSRQIRKYEVGRRTAHVLPGVSRFLHADMQRGDRFVWLEVELNEDQAPEDHTRSFLILGTGETVPPGARHRGTFLEASGLFVWHLYEDAPPPYDP